MNQKLINEEDLQNAKTYSEYLEIATELDKKDGKWEFRENPESDLFDSKLLIEDTEKLKNFRETNQTKKLLDKILETLPTHSWELNNSDLYTSARSGTKFIIDEYYLEIEKAIRFVAKSEIPELSLEKKINLLNEGNRIHGETALILSGGASFGIYHLGVVKALFENSELPKIISGSSMGAIVAAAVCTRNDKDLKKYFDELLNTHKVALKFSSIQKFLESKSIMDEEQLLEHIQGNMPNLSFLEAYKISGRVLNISVSATRKRQKPKVLNYLSSPSVLIQNSALASCAIPGLFQAVGLKQKNEDGEIFPYMEKETWIDGSIHLDVPMQRIMRLHNVSRSIVSQANPHVLPFVPEKKEFNPISFTWNYFLNGIQFQTNKFLEAGISLSDQMPWLFALDKIKSMMAQEYRGDINISYPMSFKSISHIAANPDDQLFKDYIEKGEKATWEKLKFISHQSLLNKVLNESIQSLKFDKK